MNNSSAAPDDHEAPVPWRIQWAVYGAGLFSNSSLNLYNVVVPLWIVLLQPSPFMIGIAIGSRQVLPMLFSIHGGALMDRLGTRRVMLVFAGTAVFIPLLYPLLPSMPAIIVLQMMGGFTVMMCWVGAQSFIGHTMKGNPTYAGRLTVATRLGGFAGPPLVGLLWDLAGHWGAFGFMTFWALGTFVSTLLLPADSVEPEETTDGVTRTPRGLSRLLPRWGDYVSAFSLMAIPAIALVMAATLLRHSSTGMQSSFYVVYLNQVGITGTAIGVLFSLAGLFGGVGSLSVGWLARRIAQRALLLSAVAVLVLMITITPLLGTFVLLAIAMAGRGMFSGVAQAMEIALIAQSAGRAAQAKGAALRLTVGRIAAVIVPVLMGAIAEFVGLEMAFYLVGGTILFCIALLAMRPARNQTS
ncbi:MAG: MFS transporter [Rhodospirillaceae bacterium]|nr:MFS transporter [Rhodospirillaceae bacterium]MBT5455222.1 MFS transporter [Rhodospirillaceae bacterium]